MIFEIDKFVCENTQSIINEIIKENKTKWEKVGEGGLYKTINNLNVNFEFYKNLKKELFKKLNVNNVLIDEHCLDYITYFANQTSFNIHVDKTFNEYNHKRINFVLNNSDCDVYLFSKLNRSQVEFLIKIVFF